MLYGESFTMSGFSDAALEKKLAELNNSQQSIQTLSLWLIHHRKHHASIVKIWLKEFTKAKDSRKLTFIYLVNDVIQNSRKKGPEFRDQFGPILGPALKLMGQAVNDENTQKRLERILNIWGDRNMFDSKQISEFRKSLELCFKRRFDNGEPPVKMSRRDRGETLENVKENREQEDPDKNKKERRKSECNEVIQFDKEGKKEVHITLSPKLPANDAPEPEELIKALQTLENAASSDGIVRKKITELPSEVSDVSLLSKISDQTQAEALTCKVNEAVELLNDYNGRLLKEMEDRKSVTKMLHEFTAAQKELLIQAEERLQEYKEKLCKVYQVREELRSHVSSLPDLSQLPDVSAVPLPSAGDLFSLR